jgi:hypothetical protein
MNGRPRALDLARAELFRLLHRRAIRNSIALLVVVFIVGTVAAFVFYTPLSQSETLPARASQLAEVQRATAAYAQCLQTLPHGRSVMDTCGLAPGDQKLGDFTQFLTVKPFLLSITMPQLAQALGLVIAVVAFFMGVTWIGTEWSTGSISLLATWESHRARLLFVKALVLSGAVATAAAVLQLAWIPASLLLARERGVAGPDPFPWRTALSLDLRLICLAVVATLTGFALAHLTRSSAAAVGVAFAYTLGFEGGIRWLSPSFQSWLLSDNVLALIHPRRLTLTWSDSGQVMVLHMSHLHAGIFMTALVLALLVPGVVWLRMGDLT